MFNNKLNQFCDLILVDANFCNARAEKHVDFEKLVYQNLTTTFPHVEKQEKHLLIWHFKSAFSGYIQEIYLPRELEDTIS